MGCEAGFASEAPSSVSSGLGYVGLPQALSFAEAAIGCWASTSTSAKTGGPAGGALLLADIPSSRVSALVSTDRLGRDVDFDRLGECDALIVCVPTPLTEYGEPDLSAVVRNRLDDRVRVCAAAS
jgi:UDP-N-acetyl-D-glucosamine dehydrogenase